MKSMNSILTRSINLKYLVLAVLLAAAILAVTLSFLFFPKARAQQQSVQETTAVVTLGGTNCSNLPDPNTSKTLQKQVENQSGCTGAEYVEGSGVIAGCVPVDTDGDGADDSVNVTINARVICAPEFPGRLEEPVVEQARWYQSPYAPSNWPRLLWNLFRGKDIVMSINLEE